VGNKWDLPSCKPWCKFKEWTENYGSMITVWTGRRATIVIGDPQVACDLLDKRSAIYSSRPRFVVMGKALNAIVQAKQKCKTDEITR
jgi:hypothetical protein